MLGLVLHLYEPIPIQRKIPLLSHLTSKMAINGGRTLLGAVEHRAMRSNGRRAVTNKADWHSSYVLSMGSTARSGFFNEVLMAREVRRICD